MASLRWLAPLLVIPACGEAPVDPVEPLARIDLRVATGQADVAPVGVTVDASGRRLVLDEQLGVLRLDDAGHATVALALADFPDPGVAIRPPFTDLVAIGDQLALTAIGDGFLLDLAAGTMSRHFCYEPGQFPEEQSQRTDALAFDPATGRLYAQPRTFDGDGAVLRSEVGMYAADSGLDLDWWDVPADLDAGGMIVTGANQLVLGAGTQLLRHDLTASQLDPVDDLARFGVARIDGLALAGDTLLVVDGARDQLVVIARDQLAF